VDPLEIGITPRLHDPVHAGDADVLAAVMLDPSINDLDCVGNVDTGNADPKDIDPGGRSWPAQLLTSFQMFGAVT
jgi:hypothetical protein